MNRVKQAIAQWQQEMPDLDLLPMEVVGYLKTTQQLTQERLQAFFKEYGLQAGEFDVLATLRRSGPPYRLGPTQLFETLMISSGGMTSRLDRLEKAGLIARSPNPEDRRGTLVSLTEKGMALMAEMIPRHVANEASMLTALSREEQQALSELLSKLLEGLADEA
ncbi:MarR family winged helix-turn-helix transcriptional regulator [Halomonas sp. BC04]|uniref:MarR family winged helix-turn-helix transcriptional regulator n=1 Tax=Halomonas sp. BC04 TaxID=1403540 RepID=UPI0003ED68DE|nr:MarR family transcriptional regulator [Halomonas sp. BC04]EWH03002.1 MarR family transcriptional regulator [Halomonas sp. BC04]